MGRGYRTRRRDETFIGLSVTSSVNDQSMSFSDLQLFLNPREKFEIMPVATVL